MQDRQRHPSPRERARIANEARQAELQAAINVAHAELCALVAEHEREGYWGDHAGILTETGYQTWRHGHTPHSARRLLEVGTSLEDLPQVAQSFSSGELCLEQVRILKDICEPETEAELVELARGLSGAQLARFASHYRSALKAERDQGHNERHLSSGHTPHGTWRMSAELASEEGAIVERALNKAVDLLRKEGSGPDAEADSPYAAERADALVAVAESFLAHGLGSRPGPERYQVIIDIDLDKLGSDGIATIRGGGIVSARTAEMILCDSSIVEIISRDGNPLDVGRKHRFPTTPLRRALEARDRCCDYPGCHRVIALDCHHDTDWVAGGATKLTGMRRYCRIHHIRKHKGEFTVEGDVYRDRHGNVIARKPLGASPGSLERLVRDTGVVVDEFTCLPEWNGERGSMRYVADLALSGRAFEKRRKEEEELQRRAQDDTTDWGGIDLPDVGPDP